MNRASEAHWMASDEDLVKVRVDLPNQPGNSEESMWARPLGGDLYELHNSPFCAYDLNYLDVVYAASGNPDHKPLIIRVERRSGHRTLRAIFDKEVARPQRLLLLKGLDKYGVTWEGSDYTRFSLDIPLQGDYEAICDQFWAWEESGLLSYETCEARAPGSFDDVERRG